MITKGILRLNLLSLIEIRHIAPLTITRDYVEQSLIESVQIPASHYVLKWICNTGNVRTDWLQPCELRQPRGIVRLPYGVEYKPSNPRGLSHTIA